MIPAGHSSLPIQETTSQAKYGIGMKAVSLLALGAGVFFLAITPFSGIMECSLQNERWITLSIGCFFMLSGILIGYTAIFGNLSWNKDTISYRNAHSKKVTALWSDISDCGEIGWASAGYIKFFSAPTLYFSSYMSNVDRLIAKAMKALQFTHPEKFYIVATRKNVKDSNTCGCLICDTIFTPANIMHWKHYLSGEDCELDVAGCPSCKHDEAVMCDGGDAPITKEGLRLVFKDACKSWSSIEKLERTNLRAKYVNP